MKLAIAEIEQLFRLLPLTGTSVNRYPSTAREWLDANDERLAQLRLTADRARHAITESVGRARSRDGAVELTVDSSGEIVELRFADSASRLGGAQLEAAIMATAREARRALIETMRDTVDELNISPAGAEVLDALGLTQGPVATEIESIDGENDWSHASVLRRA